MPNYTPLCHDKMQAYPGERALHCRDGCLHCRCPVRVTEKEGAFYIFFNSAPFTQKSPSVESRCWLGRSARSDCRNPRFRLPYRAGRKTPRGVSAGLRVLQTPVLLLQIPVFVSFTCTLVHHRQTEEEEEGGRKKERKKEKKKAEKKKEKK